MSAQKASVLPPSTEEIDVKGSLARQAIEKLAASPDLAISRFLTLLADKVLDESPAILAINKKDCAEAKDSGRTDAYIDRMLLTEARLSAITESIRNIRDLPNPVGRVLETKERPNGLIIEKKAVPIGVLGMIYESRPNVTIDAGCLAIKSGNAIILRGGSDCLRTNTALADIMTECLQEAGLPDSIIQLVRTPDRAFVDQMLEASEWIDVIIPRGGKNLTEKVMAKARMPVFAHLDGNCHLYVRGPVDIEMAKDIVLNAKLRRTGVCGAAETLLLDENLDTEDMKIILDALLDAGCDIFADETLCRMDARMQPATEEDWRTEYLDSKISAKTVYGFQAAVTHINQFGSHHTDSILTDDEEAATYFQRHVDSAIVMHNASTQFADGGEFGMGAEIGIGTGKLHGRGPVGLEQLTTFKYVVKGTGQTRPA